MRSGRSAPPGPIRSAIVRHFPVRNDLERILALLLVVQLFWGGFYIWRTSFPVEGDLRS